VRHNNNNNNNNATTIYGDTVRQLSVSIKSESCEIKDRARMLDVLLDESRKHELDSSFVSLSLLFRRTIDRFAFVFAAVNATCCSRLVRMCAFILERRRAIIQHDRSKYPAIWLDLWI